MIFHEQFPQKMSNKDFKTSKIWPVAEKTPKISKKCAFDSFFNLEYDPVMGVKFCRVVAA
jgi:hypothetical protein